MSALIQRRQESGQTVAAWRAGNNYPKASVPFSVIEHSEASASSIAHVMTEKYVNGVPLYRQSQSWMRQGIELHRNTMANWIILSTKDWLMLVYKACVEALLKERVIHGERTLKNDLSISRMQGFLTFSTIFLADDTLN